MLFGDNRRPLIAPESILQRIRAGDKTAEQLLFNQYSRQLNTILVQKSQDPELAADIVQDTFMVVLDKARQDKIDNPKALGAFIRQVGANLLTASYRKEIRRKTEASEQIDVEYADHTSDPADRIQSADMTALVLQMLDELPTDRDRDLIRRYFLYNEPKQLICQEYALTAAHFDRVIHRARQRLKHLLKQKLTAHGEDFDFRRLFALALFALIFYSLSEKSLDMQRKFGQNMGVFAFSGDHRDVRGRLVADNGHNGDEVQEYAR